ncbi:MAG TPA: hypothetical protein VNJ08_08005 [Bacteriovoracaceae bacterium]|nr:hypothetical protein [Bacteriovoracaceae bacterium]
MRHTRITALVGMLVFSTSCSWYKSLERSLVDDGGEKTNKRSRSVPREQYDQLLVKYEELSKKYESAKETPPEVKPSLVEELQRTQGENFAPAVESETVDLFASQNAAPPTPAAPAVPVLSNVSGDLDSQLTLFRKAMTLKTSNPGEATKIFQQLETEGSPAVKARSKLQIGELLLGRGQYDLALQVFEDIINRHSSSGVVLDALKFAVVCADKLGTQNKKEQYASMLNDVFEAN